MIPKRALDKVADALKLKRKGYNAFKQLASDECKIEDAVLIDGVAPFRDWRTRVLYDGLPPGVMEAMPELVEPHYKERFGSLEDAEKSAERAVETIKKRRGIGQNKPGVGSDRQIHKRVKEGRKLLNPNK
jgi:hypothetical protein